MKTYHVMNLTTATVLIFAGAAFILKGNAGRHSDVLVVFGLALVALGLWRLWKVDAD